jgi:hypothetical protein
MGIILAADGPRQPAFVSVPARLVSLDRGLDESISALDREIACWLAQTPGALADVHRRHGRDLGRGLGGRIGRD